LTDILNLNKIEMPHHVVSVMYLITERDYQCFMVGDTVRKLLLGEPMGDIDVITNAEVERVEYILDNYRVIDINTVQGEIMVMAGGIPVMIRSYRRGKNEDGTPIFGGTLIDELKQRDFTINTICADLYGNIVDPFNGVNCIISEPFTLKAVGENEPPTTDENGEEHCVPLSVEKDPLFMLKALELMGSGDYIISEKTSNAIMDCSEKVKELKPKVLREAFEKILSAKRVSDVFLEYVSIVTNVFPELIPTLDFDQKSIFQNYTLYEHLCKSVGFSFPDISLRYALLLHGVGKPDCQALTSNGSATYYGHGERSMLIARRALERLEVPKDIIEDVSFMIIHHDMGEILDEHEVTALLEKYSKADLRKLLLMASANLRAKSPENDQKANNLKKLSESLLK
jgi:tRNA nucleotidyltransferase (CCA-adding enzyme)